jgi:tetratricopeptide (TPR) repeat protein
LSSKISAAQRLRPLVGLLFCLPILCASQANGTAAVPSLYTQAEKAIIAGEYSRAEQLLQQLIQQNPQWPGAWLDLALLATRRGQYAQAQEYLQALDDQFAPLPEPIAQAVLRLRDQLLEQLKEKKDQMVASTGFIPPSQRQNILLFGAGVETNANAGLPFSTITLTPPGGNVLVSLDPGSQARGASSTRAALSHFGQEPWNEGSVSWQVQVQARQYSISQLSSNEVLAQSSIEQGNLPGRFMVGWQAIWLDSRPAYQTPILRWQYDIALANDCGWQQYFQTETRQYQQANYLDSRWQAYRSIWRCQSAATRSQFFVQAASEAARTPDRPGGNSHHRSVGVQQEWLHPFGIAEHTLLARMDMHYIQDTKGYSSFLENGLARQLRKTDAQIAWSAPWEGQRPWRWSVGLQKTTQRSNIDFFFRENNSIETSIWRDW